MLWILLLLLLIHSVFAFDEPRPDESAWELGEIARCGCVGCCPLKRTTVTKTETITAFNDCLVTTTLSLLYTTLQVETTTTASTETTTSTVTFTLTTTFLRYQQVTSQRTKTVTSQRTFTLSTNLLATFAVGTDTTSDTSLFTAFFTSATTTTSSTVSLTTQLVLTQTTVFTGASVIRTTDTLTSVVITVLTVPTDTTITAFFVSVTSLDAFTYSVTDRTTSTVRLNFVSLASFTSTQASTPVSYVETLGWDTATLTLPITAYIGTGPEFVRVATGTTSYTFSLIPPP